LAEQDPSESVTVEQYLAEVDVMMRAFCEVFDSRRL